MLGVGLHSYGFMDGAPFWLGMFVLSQLAIMALAFVPTSPNSIDGECGLAKLPVNVDLGAKCSGDVLIADREDTVDTAPPFVVARDLLGLTLLFALLLRRRLVHCRLSLSGFLVPLRDHRAKKFFLFLC